MKDKTFNAYLVAFMLLVVGCWAVSCMSSNSNKSCINYDKACSDAYSDYSNDQDFGR